MVFKCSCFICNYKSINHGIIHLQGKEKVEVLVEQENASFKNEIWNHERRFNFPSNQERSLNADELQMQSETKYNWLPIIWGRNVSLMIMQGWWGCGSALGQWYKLVQPLWRTVWQHSQEIKMFMPFTLSGCTLGKHLHKEAWTSMFIAGPLLTANRDS